MWADIAAWFQSPGGARVVQTAVVPALAILVAGVLAALIGRAAVGAAIRRADREQAATAVAGLVEAARAVAEADGSRGDRRRAARLRTEADVRVRLLPLPGAARAADWAAARTDALGQAEDPSARVAEVRDALIAWVGRPRRARRIFTAPGSGPSPATTPTAAQDQETGEAAAVPAWQRTRSAERLQQQREARTAEGPREDTAPVRLQHAHRAEPARIVEAEQLEQAETRVPSPYARPEPATATATAERSETPEWLDDYDDEAHVTRTMDLRTPPPVSASAMRNRAPNSDIVPRP